MVQEETKKKKSPKSRGAHPSNKGQNYRTFRNKMNQRARHQLSQPNDHTVDRAKRWVSRPSETTAIKR